MIVQLQRVADSQWNARAVGGDAREFRGRADLIDDDAVALPEIAELTSDHDRRAADETGVVEPDHDAGLESAVVEPRAQHSLVDRHRPLHAFHAAHAQDFRIAQRFDVFDVLHLPINHPDIGKRNIGQETVGAGHDADEDRGLLRHQERGKGKTDHDADIFGSISDEHLQRDESHTSEES